MKKAKIDRSIDRAASSSPTAIAEPCFNLVRTSSTRMLYIANITFRILSPTFIPRLKNSLSKYHLPHLFYISSTVIRVLSFIFIFIFQVLLFAHYPLYLFIYFTHCFSNIIVHIHLTFQILSVYFYFEYYIFHMFFIYIFSN